jgi:gliding motility-associated-like protein
VIVENQFGCKIKDEINVLVNNIPEVTLGEDVVACEDIPSVAANIKKGNEITYSWSTGSTDSLITPSKAGKYWVTVSNQCGNFTDSVKVFSFKDIFIPNVVTPNHDGLNEKLAITGLGTEVTGRLEIYDRWGGKIFSQNNYKGDWPFENEIPASGVYYYVLSYPHCKTYKGWVQVLK